MPNTDAAFNKYIQAINTALRSGSTTEHTHRAALIELINSFETGLTVINEPGRIGESAPDLLIRKGEAILGYIETKDIGFNLAKWKRTDQCKRYLAQFDNLILSNYVDFQWFIDGNPEPVETRRLGDFEGSKVSSILEGCEYTKTLLANFLERKPTKVGRVNDLAKRMAAKAKAISELLLQELKDKGSKSPLFSQLLAFRKTLISDLEESDFADMYAQTLAYGLFAARDQHRYEDKAGDFTLVRATSFIPKSNPFLRQLFRMESGELMEMKNVAWMIEDLVQLLRYCDIGLIMEDFGKKMGRHDPVIDLYETFLKHYDPKMREMRGVYYTPEPVVSYIVRSIDELLISEFGKKQGLADPEVMILDPAVGTGTFLFHTIKLIHKRVKETMGEGAWDSYVRENLIPRLFGFELLMAPYTICHLKLGLLLLELGYKFRDDDRLHIYLTNALEPGIPLLRRDETELLFASEIVKEAKDAAEVKTEKPIWVVMGNPPYSGHSANKGKWISDLLKGKDVDIDGVIPRSYYDVEGQPLNERNPKWLQDDYVKFLRFAQWRIEKTGHGIVGMITNHGWLDNPTFRGMREKLIKAFDLIYVLDLHGNSKKKEKAPDGSPDENVFDIQQGVAISLFIKRVTPEDSSAMRADLWGKSGKREEEPQPSSKYGFLANTSVSLTDWKALNPSSPSYLMAQTDKDLQAEYLKGKQFSEIFPISSVGFVTSRDSFALDFERDAIARRIDEFFDQQNTDYEIAQKYGLRDTRDWKLSTARMKKRHKYGWNEVLTECLYRPFDNRWIYYGNSLIEMPRPEVMRQMLGDENIALITNKREEIAGPWGHAFVTDCISEHGCMSSKTTSYHFPLFIHYEGDDCLPVPRANIDASFLREFEDKLGVTEKSLEPRAVFNYIYAILHSPTYRSRYAQFLKMDFPRIPQTSDYELFLKLSDLGGELVKLHLLKHGMLAESKVRFEGMCDNAVEKVRYNDLTERVHINAMQYFTSVEKKHWEFMIGGYPVLYKWLKEREKAKRRLDLKDIQHFQKMVAAVDMTINLMADIDRAIPKWPIE